MGTPGKAGQFMGITGRAGQPVGIPSKAGQWRAGAANLSESTSTSGASADPLGLSSSTEQSVTGRKKKGRKRGDLSDSG